MYQKLLFTPSKSTAQQACRDYYIILRLRDELLTAITMYIGVLWDLTLCNLVETYKCFGATASIFV